MKLNNRKLNNRTILLTGGTSGIGFELARQLLARGNTIIVTGRDAAKLQAAQQSLPGLHIAQSDVADPAAIGALYADITARFPALDTLINNAGIMRNISLTQPHALADLTAELETNLAGPIRMVQQFLPHLLTRKQALIINVSSGLAFIPLAGAPVYSAAKAGLHSYTQSLRMQLRGTSVAVVELAPPAVETPLLRAQFTAEMKRPKGMDVETLARHALIGLESGRLEIRPGLANVLKAMSRIAPDFMLHQLTRMTQRRV